jgi:hypothetical protein
MAKPTTPQTPRAEHLAAQQALNPIANTAGIKGAQLLDGASKKQLKKTTAVRDTEEEELLQDAYAEAPSAGDDVVIAQANTAAPRDAAPVASSGGSAQGVAAAIAALTPGQMAAIGAGLLAVGAVISNNDNDSKPATPAESLTVDLTDGVLTLSKASGNVLLTFDDAEEPTAFVFLINGTEVHRVAMDDFDFDEMVLDGVNLTIDKPVMARLFSEEAPELTVNGTGNLTLLVDESVESPVDLLLNVDIDGNLTIDTPDDDSLTIVLDAASVIKLTGNLIVAGGVLDATAIEDIAAIDIEGTVILNSAIVLTVAQVLAIAGAMEEGDTGPIQTNGSGRIIVRAAAEDFEEDGSYAALVDALRSLLVDQGAGLSAPIVSFDTDGDTLTAIFEAIADAEDVDFDLTLDLTIDQARTLGDKLLETDGVSFSLRGTLEELVDLANEEGIGAELFAGADSYTIEPAAITLKVEDSTVAALADNLAAAEADHLAGPDESAVTRADVIAGAANTGDVSITVDYTLLDSLENLYNAPEGVVSGADAYTLTDNTVWTVEGATVEEAQAVYAAVAALVEGAANDPALDVPDVFAWTLSDTLANLLAAKEDGVFTGASGYSLTDPAGDLGTITLDQYKILVAAGNADDYTYFLPAQLVAETSVNEGFAVDVDLTGVPDGTYTYSVAFDDDVTAGDFAASTTGTVTVVNGVGTFQIVTRADQITEGVEQFTVSVTIGEGDTAQVVSATITINDTSMAPENQALRLTTGTDTLPPVDNEEEAPYAFDGRLETNTLWQWSFQVSGGFNKASNDNMVRLSFANGSYIDIELPDGTPSLPAIRDAIALGLEEYYSVTVTLSGTTLNISYPLAEGQSVGLELTGVAFTTTASGGKVPNVKDTSINSSSVDVTEATFTNGDVLTGSDADDDSLVAELLAGTTVTPGEITGVEELYFTVKTPGSAATVDMTNVSGATQLWNDSSLTSLQLNDVQEMAKLGMRNLGGGGTYSVNYSVANGAGAEPIEQDVVLVDVGDAEAAAGLYVSGLDIDVLNITSNSDVELGPDDAATVNRIRLGAGLGGNLLSLGTLTVAGTTGLEVDFGYVDSLVDVQAGDFDAGLKLTSASTALESVVVGDGDDDITLTGALSGEDGVSIDLGDGDNTLLVGPGVSIAVPLPVASANITVSAGAGKDSIDVTTTGVVTVDAGDGENSVTVMGADVDVMTGDDDDSIEVTATGDVTIDAGDGENTVTVHAGATTVSITTGEDDDRIYIDGDYLDGQDRLTVNAGAGVDTLVLMTGEDGGATLEENVTIDFTQLTGLEVFEVEGDLDGAGWALTMTNLEAEAFKLAATGDLSLGELVIDGVDDLTVAAETVVLDAVTSDDLVTLTVEASEGNAGLYLDGSDDNLVNLTSLSVKSSADVFLVLEGVEGDPGSPASGTPLSFTVLKGSNDDGKFTFTASAFTNPIEVIYDSNDSKSVAAAIRDNLTLKSYFVITGSNDEVVLTWKSDVNPSAVSVSSTGGMSPTSVTGGTFEAATPPTPGSGFEDLSTITVEAEDDATVSLTGVYGTFDLAVTAGATGEIVLIDTPNVTKIDVTNVAGLSNVDVTNANLAGAEVLTEGVEQGLVIKVGEGDLVYTTSADNGVSEAFSFVGTDIGAVRITGFSSDGGDMLDFSAFTGITGEADLEVVDSGGDTLITFAGTDADPGYFAGSITLLGVTGLVVEDSIKFTMA